MDDLIDGLVRLARTDEPLPVNLGAPDERTLLEVARPVIRLTGSSSAIRVGPLPEDDPAVRRPDVTRACRLLGWEPTIDLEEGLRRTIAAFPRTPSPAVARTAPA